MHTSTFFRLFPPPKFLAMKHAGLDISDEGIHCIEYDSTTYPRKIEKFAKLDLVAGLIEGGDFRNEEELIKVLGAFAHKNKLSYVKVSIPEEKVYLFQTDVPSAETNIVRQNIEFKMEENVPLPVSEALFSFDLLPASLTNGSLRASVSVVPLAYMERYMSILSKAGMSAIAFEVVPKAISRACIPRDSDKTHLIVNMMRSKTGLYIVSQGVVCFSSTVKNINQDELSSRGGTYVGDLSKEINRIYQYWLTHGGSESPIEHVLLSGYNSSKYESQLQGVIVGVAVTTEAANVWQNVFNINKYMPPIPKEESLEYAVAAGLAMPLLI